MCHSPKNNRKIKKIHEKCLKIIYNYKQSSFMKLPKKDNSVTIHSKKPADFGY